MISSHLHVFLVQLEKFSYVQLRAARIVYKNLMVLKMEEFFSCHAHICICIYLFATRLQLQKDVGRNGKGN